MSLFSRVGQRQRSSPFSLFSLRARIWILLVGFTLCVCDIKARLLMRHRKHAACSKRRSSTSHASSPSAKGDSDPTAARISSRRPGKSSSVLAWNDSTWHRLRRLSEVSSTLAAACTPGRSKIAVARAAQQHAPKQAATQPLLRRALEGQREALRGVGVGPVHGAVHQHHSVQVMQGSMENLLALPKQPELATELANDLLMV